MLQLLLPSILGVVFASWLLVVFGLRGAWWLFCFPGAMVPGREALEVHSPNTRQLLRDYFAAHPGGTVREAKEFIGLPLSTLHNAVQSLMQRREIVGEVAAAAVGRPQRYRLATDPQEMAPPPLTRLDLVLCRSSDMLASLTPTGTRLEYVGPLQIFGIRGRGSFSRAR